MTQRGRFITFEGGEGAGKSTQARRLAAQLQDKDIACTLTREPGGAPGAEQIRKLLVEGEPGRWDALTEMLLMFAARADHVAHTIAPALKNGSWVISDRFADSTYAYQGAGRGLETDRIAAVEKTVLGALKPDLTLIIDLPVEEGLRRAKARHTSEDRYENFNDAFHRRLHTFYRELAAREPQRCVLMDATGSEEEVAGRIWRAVTERFGL